MTLFQALLEPIVPATSNDNPELRQTSLAYSAGTAATAGPAQLRDQRPLGDDPILFRSPAYSPPALVSRRGRTSVAAEPSANLRDIDHEALLLALDQAGLLPPQAPGTQEPANAASITKSVSVPVEIHVAGSAAEGIPPRATSAASSPDTMTAKSSTWGFLAMVAQEADSKKGKSRLGGPAWQLGHARESFVEGMKLGMKFFLDVSFRRRQPPGVRLLIFVIIMGFVTVMVNYRSLTPATLKQVSRHLSVLGLRIRRVPNRPPYRTRLWCAARLMLLGTCWQRHQAQQ